MIPALDENGLLPIGVWTCRLEEVPPLFVTNQRRRELWDGLSRFRAAEFPHVLQQIPMFLDGSFCRSKDHPADIDVVLDLSVLADEIAVPIIVEVAKRHDEIKDQYHLDLYTKHPFIPNDLSKFFQYVGDKAALDLGLHPKDHKGILRVLP